MLAKKLRQSRRPRNRACGRQQVAGMSKAELRLIAEEGFDIVKRIWFESGAISLVGQLDEILRQFRIQIIDARPLALRQKPLSPVVFKFCNAAFGLFIHQKRQALCIPGMQLQQLAADSSAWPPVLIVNPEPQAEGFCMENGFRYLRKKPLAQVRRIVRIKTRVKHHAIQSGFLELADLPVKPGSFKWRIDGPESV